MNQRRPRIAYITAGAAGMYCGSCMRDNTLVSALHQHDVDVALIPTYTPIRTDEENVSIDHVFFGGINVYLQQKLSIFRHLPKFIDRWLDSPRLIRSLARDVETRPEQLGELTLSMLRGEAGFQSKEVHNLIDWLADSFRPDVINLSNMLIAGCVPALKERLNVPILVTLQGDDIFLDSLVEPFRERAMEAVRRLIPHVDGFLVFSQFYADYMAEYFSIPSERIRRVPLGINTEGFAKPSEEASLPGKDGVPTIGYLARLAPEKGLHLLVDAFLELKRQPSMRDARLLIAGWLGKQNRKYAEDLFTRLDQAGLGTDYEYLGAVDRQQKLSFLSRIDVLSVPTTYQEPKGLFLLEALAAGVPFVQPSHGAFPELLSSTGGGELCRPNDSEDLTRTLTALLLNDERRVACGVAGRQAVLERHSADIMAQKTLEVYEEAVRD